MLNPLRIHPHNRRLTVGLVLAAATAGVLITVNISSADPVVQNGVKAGTAVVPTVVPAVINATPAVNQALPLPAKPPVVAKPVLPSVTLIRPSSEMWPAIAEASGYVMPWQEIHIGTEIGGLRLSSILVSVGDTVKKGQILARLNAATVETDLDSANAQQAEAEGTLVQAVATLDRAKRLAPSGGVSQQDLTLYETQKHTAEARLNSAKALVKRQQLRLENATLMAPDDGVISSSSVSEGMIVPAGSDLFRLIRQGRLEWHAEVAGEVLLKLTPGQEAVVKSPLGAEVKGRLRRVSPTIDMTTHKGVVYVDIPAGAPLKSGLNVSGVFNIGKQAALVLPASAVLRRDGKAKVYTLNADHRIEATEVTIGRVMGERVEILSGVSPQDLVVSKGLNTLKVGEQVLNTQDEG